MVGPTWWWLMELVLWMWCQRRVSLLRMRKTCLHLLNKPGELCHTTPDSIVGGRELSVNLTLDIRYHHVFRLLKMSHCPRVLVFFIKLDFERRILNNKVRQWDTLERHIMAFKIATILTIFQCLHLPGMLSLIVEWYRSDWSGGGDLVLAMRCHHHCSSVSIRLRSWWAEQTLGGAPLFHHQHHTTQMYHHLYHQEKREFNS